jgi:hypothetical protein
MEFRHRNSISSAAEDRAMGPCSLRDQGKTMITISRMALIAAIAAADIASPASAQSFDPEAGSGNVAGFSYVPSPAQNDEFAVPQSCHAKTAARRNGLHAFARVPGASSNSSSNQPAFTGGGSACYDDQMLQQY